MGSPGSGRKIHESIPLPPPLARKQILRFRFVITFLDQSGATRQYDISAIQSITFGGAGTPPVTSSSSSSSLPPAASPTLPAGTEIAVRTNEAIDSSSSPEGATFSAGIDRNIPSTDGSILIPKGAPARLIIRKSSSGGGGGAVLGTLLGAIAGGGRGAAMGAAAGAAAGGATQVLTRGRQVKVPPETVLTFRPNHPGL